MLGFALMVRLEWGHDPKLRSDVLILISFRNCKATIVLGRMVLYDRYFPVNLWEHESQSTLGMIPNKEIVIKWSFGLMSWRAS